MAGAWGIFSSHNYAGVDQGVDFRGSGPIPALDAATVTDVGSASIVEGGSYPYVVYRLNTGPYRGSFVYTAENFTPTVHKGQRLRQGQSIGRAAGKYPYIEVGFNKTATGWNAVAPLGGATPAGAAMKKYIYGLIGTAAPVTVPDVGASFTGPTGPGSGGPGVSQAVGAAKGAASAVAATGSFFGHLLDPSFWLRALEVVGGGLFLLLGLYLLTRQAGVTGAPQPPTPGLSDETLASLQRTPGPAPARTRRKRVYEVSEAAERRAARRRRLEGGVDPATSEIPF